jgi:hypothetical protein
MTTTETLNLPIWQGLVTADVQSKETVETEKIEKVGKVSDFALAQSAAKGDMFSFEELYQRHHRRVYSICLRMLQNASEAEDLTQDVFIQLYRKIGSFRGDSAFTTWLHRMTVNQVLMHFRKRPKKVKHRCKSWSARQIRARCRLLTRLRLKTPSNSFRQVTKMSSFCTMSKATNTKKSLEFWAVRSELQNRNCTKRV